MKQMYKRYIFWRQKTRSGVRVLEDVRILHLFRKWFDGAAHFYTQQMNQTVHAPAPPTARRRASGKEPGRTNDPERTKANILAVAAQEFGAKGLAGARIDEIAAATHTSKRMIYYYFGSKEQLYLAVLENAYRGIREAEQALDVGDLEPVEALRRLAELTYDHHLASSEFIRLIAIENIHRGRFITQLDSLRELNKPALGILDEILRRGRENGSFRPEIESLDVHMLISSYCVFQVANQHTFGYLFDVDLQKPERRDHLRGVIGDVVVAWLSAPAA